MAVCSHHWPVTNEGTACVAGSGVEVAPPTYEEFVIDLLKERMVAVEKRCAEAFRRTLAECEPVTNEGTACVAGEIKPLDYWRRLDEEVAAGRSEIAVPAEGVELSYDVFVEMLRASDPRRFFLVRVDRPARAPFPALALRDRPWDISALVEE